MATVTVGANPLIPTTTPDGTYAYIPNYDDGTVSVINTNNDTVIATLTIGVGSHPSVVYVTPDGTKAYVPADGSNFVYVFNTSTNTEIGTISVGNAPEQVVFTANSATAYVGNFNGNSISIIDVVSDTVTGTISVSANPDTLSITPDGTQLLLTHYTTPSTLDLIDLPSNTLIKTVTLGNHSSYIAYGVVSPPIMPPSSLSGVKKKQRFLSQTNIVDTIYWSTPSSGATPVSYYVYRNNLQTLIGVVPANGKLNFSDNNLQKRTPYTYYVVSVDIAGNQSSPISVTVLP